MANDLENRFTGGGAWTCGGTTDLSSLISLTSHNIVNHLSMIWINFQSESSFRLNG